MSTFKFIAFFSNEFPAYFGKCSNLNSIISQNMQKIHLKVNIWLELDLKAEIGESEIMLSYLTERIIITKDFINQKTTTTGKSLAAAASAAAACIIANHGYFE